MSPEAPGAQAVLPCSHHPLGKSFTCLSQQLTEGKKRKPASLTQIHPASSTWQAAFARSSSDTTPPPQQIHRASPNREHKGIPNPDRAGHRQCWALPV